jgi:hypothetical protein
MKYFLILMFITFSVHANVEKVADSGEYQIATTNRADLTSGNIDGSQTYDRLWVDGSNGGSCDYVGSDSSNDGVGYQTFQFHSPSGQMADIEVALNTLPDSVLFIYCSFDPLNPTVDLAAIDDDGGVGFGSAITPADGVQLQPNVVYTAVVTGYDNTEFGTFDLVLGGDLVFGGPAPVEALPVPAISTLAILLLILAMGFVVKRRLTS